VCMCVCLCVHTFVCFCVCAAIATLRAPRGACSKRVTCSLLFYACHSQNVPQRPKNFVPTDFISHFSAILAHSLSRFLSCYVPVSVFLHRSFALPHSLSPTLSRSLIPSSLRIYLSSLRIYLSHAHTYTHIHSHAVSQP